MGFSQTLMKACSKPEKDPAAFENLLLTQADNLRRNGDQDGTRPEAVEVVRVTPENFDRWWKDQENVKPEAVDRYRVHASNGRLWAIDIDW
jgi:hypothetical protein